MDSQKIKVSITVNLDFPLAQLQHSLQTVINLASMGLDSSPKTSFRLPILPAVTFSENLKWEPSEALETYHNWITCNGIRDAIEGFSVFLESIKQVLLIQRLRETQASGSSLTGADHNEATIHAPKKFHRLGLPDKLQNLQITHELPLDKSLCEHVLSINIARNCLVHRNGTVTEKDINHEGAMRISWRHLRLFAKNEDGEFDLTKNLYIEKESNLYLSHENKEKTFKIGEKITFTIEEFAEITWCLFVAGEDVSRKTAQLFSASSKTPS